MFSICRNFLEIFSGSFTVTIKINSSKKTVFHRETFIPMQMQMYQILIFSLFPGQCEGEGLQQDGISISCDG